MRLVRCRSVSVFVGLGREGGREARGPLEDGGDGNAIGTSGAFAILPVVRDEILR